MELKLLPVFLCLLGGGFSNPILSVVPTTFGVGVGGGQNLVSTYPSGVFGSQSQVLTTLPSQQSQILQLVRQPTGLVGLGTSGGLTQFMLPGQQQAIFNGVGGLGGVPLLTTTSGVSGVVNPNGVGVTTANGLGYSVVNYNGVPVLVSNGGLGLNNGIVQTGLVPQQLNVNGAPSIVQPSYLTQPVIREVAEVQEVETPASLVQLDSMDAALLDMENKGQIHMEKYAWGRNNLNNKATTSQDNAAAALRSDISRYYSPLPTGSIVSPQPVDIITAQQPSTQSQLRNPFVDANGKRKKHFEFYQYFRNLNPQQQTVIPVNINE